MIHPTQTPESLRFIPSRMYSKSPIREVQPFLEVVRASPNSKMINDQKQIQSQQFQQKYFISAKYNGKTPEKNTPLQPQFFNISSQSMQENNSLSILKQQSKHQQQQQQMMNQTKRDDDQYITQVNRHLQPLQQNYHSSSSSHTPTNKSMTFQNHPPQQKSPALVRSTNLLQQQIQQTTIQSQCPSPISEKPVTNNNKQDNINNIKELEQKLNLTQNENDRLNSLLLNKENEIKALKEVNIQLQENYTKITEQYNQYLQLMQISSNQQQPLVEASKGNQNLTKTANYASSSSTSQSIASNSNKGLNSSTQDIQTSQQMIQFQNLQKQQEQIQFNYEIERLNELVKSTQQELSEWVAKYKESEQALIQAQINENASKQQSLRVNELEIRLKVMQTENDTFNKLLREKVKEVQEYKDIAQHMENEKEALRQTVQDLSEQVDSWKKNVQNLGNNINMQHQHNINQNQDLCNINAQNNSNFEDLLGENDHLNDLLETRNSELQIEKEKVSQLEVQVKILNQEIEKFRQFAIEQKQQQNVLKQSLQLTEKQLHQQQNIEIELQHQLNKQKEQTIVDQSIKSRQHYDNTAETQQQLHFNNNQPSEFQIDWTIDQTNLKELEEVNRDLEKKITQLLEENKKLETVILDLEQKVAEHDLHEKKLEKERQKLKKYQGELENKTKLVIKENEKLNGIIQEKLDTINSLNKQFIIYQQTQNKEISTATSIASENPQPQISTQQKISQFEIQVLDYEKKIETLIQENEKISSLLQEQQNQFEQYTQNSQMTQQNLEQQVLQLQQENKNLLINNQTQQNIQQNQQDQALQPPQSEQQQNENQENKINIEIQYVKEELSSLKQQYLEEQTNSKQKDSEIDYLKKKLEQIVVENNTLIEINEVKVNEIELLNQRNEVYLEGIRTDFESSMRQRIEGELQELVLKYQQELQKLSQEVDDKTNQITNFEQQIKDQEEKIQKLIIENQRITSISNDRINDIEVLKNLLQSREDDQKTSAPLNENQGQQQSITSNSLSHSKSTQIMNNNVQYQQQLTGRAVQVQQFNSSGSPARQQLQKQNNYSTDYKICQQSHEMLMRELNSMRQELIEKNKQVKVLKIEIDKLKRKEFDQKEDELRITSEIKQLQAENNQLQTQRFNDKQEIQKLYDLLKNRKDEIDALNQELDQLKNELCNTSENCSYQLYNVHQQQLMQQQSNQSQTLRRDSDNNNGNSIYDEDVSGMKCCSSTSASQQLIAEMRQVNNVYVFDDKITEEPEEAECMKTLSDNDENNSKSIKEFENSIKMNNNDNFYNNNKNINDSITKTTCKFEKSPDKKQQTASQVFKIESFEDFQKQYESTILNQSHNNNNNQNQDSKIENQTW